MLGVDLSLDQYLGRVQVELQRVDLPAVRRLADLLYQAYERQKFVFLLGNGGSACTASHVCEDLAKNCLSEADLRVDGKQRLKIMSLTDNVGWITAIGNDLGYDQIFVQQLAHFGTAGDLLLAISGSGNSPNVLAAVEWANRHGLVTFGLSGFNGGKLKTLQHDGLHVALDDMAMVESVHVCVIHWLVDDLYARVNRLGRHAGKEVSSF